MKQPTNLYTETSRMKDILAMPGANTKWATKLQIPCPNTHLPVACETLIGRDRHKMYKMSARAMFCMKTMVTLSMVIAWYFMVATRVKMLPVRPVVLIRKVQRKRGMRYSSGLSLIQSVELFIIFKIKTNTSKGKLWQYKH